MKKNFFHIVLHEAQIPQNAGNIARLCVANDLMLHFIEPMGFEITDKNLKRAGLDYWRFLKYKIHPSWEDFLSENSIDLNGDNYWLLTTKSKKPYWDVKFKTGDYLIFGSESKGLPEELLKTYAKQACTIPMSSDNSRSLNLASSAQTVYYEAFRQQDYS